MFIVMLYSLCLTYGLVRYSRYATRYINALRSDVDKLEQRLARAEGMLARSTGHDAAPH
jgi:hypothetical protein